MEFLVNPLDVNDEMSFALEATAPACDDDGKCCSSDGKCQELD